MKGSCLCGAVVYQVRRFYPEIANCHCGMCRKFHGAAFATYGKVQVEDLQWLAKNCSKFLYHQVLLSGDSAQNMVLVCITSLLAKSSSFHWRWALWTRSQTEQWITVSSVTPGLNGREIIRVFRSMASGPRSSGPLMCFIPVIADTHIDYQGH